MKTWSVRTLTIRLGLGVLVALGIWWSSLHSPVPVLQAQPVSTPAPVPIPALLQESWASYRQRFIQPDGRVIDRETNQRSISEAQAYAMWRAVLINDQPTFDRVWQWSENNLNAGIRAQDTLWAWSWGQKPNGTWGVLDPSVASDADLDAALSLIFAQRQWRQERYLTSARRKLNDLWQLCTAEVKGQRYFLPGEVSLFSNTDSSPSRLFSGIPSPSASSSPAPSQTFKLNPSYWAPYAFRIFAQVDPEHDWLGLVNSTYSLLTRILNNSPAGLPPDWLLIDRITGELRPILSRPSENNYSFDAFRVWWRLALDARYFSQSPAPALLRQSLNTLQQRWQQQQMIPASLTLAGQPTVTYESLAQYGALYPAFQVINPPLAAQIKTQKFDPAYRQGFWESDTAYYTQNLVWMGLSAGELPPSSLLTP